MNKPISPEKKTIARHALAIFGGKPKVQAYHHDDLPLSVDILSVSDSPEDGIVSYGTIGLFETPLPELATRVELCGAMPIEIEHWANILASAAFVIMRLKRAVRPGNVLEGYVSEYYHGTTLPHLYLTAPFLWGRFSELQLESGIKVNWLQGIPISNAELEFLRHHGEEEFEDRLEAEGADIYDLKRASIVLTR